MQKAPIISNEGYRDSWWSAVESTGA